MWEAKKKSRINCLASQGQNTFPILLWKGQVEQSRHIYIDPFPHRSNGSTRSSSSYHQNKRAGRKIKSPSLTDIALIWIIWITPTPCFQFNKMYRTLIIDFACDLYFASLPLPKATVTNSSSEKVFHIPSCHAVHRQQEGDFFDV